MIQDWYSIWYEPDENDHLAYLSDDRIAEIGGAPNGLTSSKPASVHFVNQGNAKLAQWCRQHCIQPGSPVNVRGKTAWAFQHETDALLFKLTWG